MSKVPNHIEAITNSSLREREQEIWLILQQVADPEIPVLSVVDLGIIRKVEVSDNIGNSSQSKVTITITPTYSGCPAMNMIAMQTRMALLQHGYEQVEINTVLSPAWTTDWMSEEGKQKLQQYGIAPPVGKASDSLHRLEGVPCPQCSSTHTRLLSEFGSTNCKALLRCDDCLEVFDYFKCH